jgi:hypothetical protein
MILSKYCAPTLFLLLPALAYSQENGAGEDLKIPMAYETAIKFADDGRCMRGAGMFIIDEGKFVLSIPQGSLKQHNSFLIAQSPLKDAVGEQLTLVGTDCSVEITVRISKLRTTKR